MWMLKGNLFVVFNYVLGWVVVEEWYFFEGMKVCYEFLLLSCFCLSVIDFVFIVWDVIID